MSDVFYFGCIGGTGHNMFNTHGGQVREVGDMPWGRYGEDGRLPPQEGGEVEGHALVHQRDGWTALSFWDRSVESRHGASSNFFLRGTYDFVVAVALARAAFPDVWARFKFAVVPFKGDADFKEKADQILADHAAAADLRAKLNHETVVSDKRAAERDAAEKERDDLRTRLKQAEKDRDEAREYGESAYGHDVACLEMAETHERNGDMGADGLGGLFEFVKTPPIVPPWTEDPK